MSLTFLHDYLRSSGTTPIEVRVPSEPPIVRREFYEEDMRFLSNASLVAVVSLTVALGARALSRRIKSYDAQRQRGRAAPRRSTTAQGA